MVFKGEYGMRKHVAKRSLCSIDTAAKTVVTSMQLYSTPDGQER
jgi:hypothetical protein